MPLALIMLALLVALPWLTGQTFGQQCAQAYDRNTPEHERCVERMARGGGVYFEKKTVIVPIN